MLNRTFDFNKPTFDFNKAYNGQWVVVREDAEVTAATRWSRMRRGRRATIVTEADVEFPARCRVISAFDDYGQ